MVIVLLGQTATGKTSLSLRLAAELNGEIINGDAMQVYKELNIVNAKIKEDEKGNIPHHLFDIKSINEDYSVFEYQKNIRQCIEEIISRNKTPIIVGGTGLYIKAALYDYNFDTNENDFTDRFKEYSNEQLYDYLKSIDEKAALNTHPNNRKRVLRAINIYLNSGKTKSENIDSQDHKLIYDCKIFGLYLDKEQLLENINKRVDVMIADGLIDEIKNNPCTSTASKAIGYAEIKSYLDGKITKDEAIELIKIHTRQYAKRQNTWFKNQMDVIWVYNDENALNNILNEIKQTSSH